MIYKVGSRGDEVVKIQKAVGVSADGLYGARTKEAVSVWQRAHGLTADGIVGYKTWVAMFGEDMPSKAVADGIVYLPLNKHIKMLPNREIKYLAIHFTAGSTSKVGSARNVRNVFLQREASADFAVDDAEMVQFNPDLRNYYCWAVGASTSPIVAAELQRPAKGRRQRQGLCRGVCRSNKDMETNKQHIIMTRLQKIQQLKEELQSSDYIALKAFEGRDVSEHGDWQQRRQDIRDNINALQAMTDQYHAAYGWHNNKFELLGYYVDTFGLIK